MRGDAASALAELAAQYADGADPAAALREMAEITHWISVVKITPGAADDPTAPLAERARARALADALPMRALSRAWQMLLKALEEIPLAPNAMMAAEMAIIRLTHVADLPGPEEILRRLTTEGAASVPPGPKPSAPMRGDSPRAAAIGGGGQEPAARAKPTPTPAPTPDALARFASFDSVVALIREKRDAKLLVCVESYVRLARYAPGRIEFAPAPGAPQDLAGELTRRLSDWTGARWVVTVVSDAGAAPSIAERRAAEVDDLRARAATAPLVAAALALFPGAEIKAVRPLGEPEAAAAPPPPQDDDFDDDAGEDWSPVDPFAEE
jgi:DNA polymerase-3 subunit gamma/tau